MKGFINNGLFFIIPFVVYSLLIAFIDPFNYLNGFGIISEERRIAIARGIEPHLYKLIAFQNEPKKNWVLGDSRSNGLYHAMDEETWSNLAYGGASLKEVVQSFWWATAIETPDTVLIGINLNLYNKYNKRFWIEETISRKSNFFNYAFNKYTFNATVGLAGSFANSKEHSFTETENSNTEEKVTKGEYWNKKLRERDKFFKNITYPDEYYEQLNEISTYCKKEGIKLIFWIPPLHKDYHDILKKYQLDEFEDKFRSDLQTFGDVFDFNYISKLTIEEQNFWDPVHFNSRIARVIGKEIRNYSPSYSILYTHKKENQRPEKGNQKN
jgi:hypothetical protein